MLRLLNLLKNQSLPTVVKERLSEELPYNLCLLISTEQFDYSSSLLNKLKTLPITDLGESELAFNVQTSIYILNSFPKLSVQDINIIFLKEPGDSKHLKSIVEDSDPLKGFVKVHHLLNSILRSFDERKVKKINQLFEYGDLYLKTLCIVGVKKMLSLGVDEDLPVRGN